MSTVRRCSQKGPQHITAAHNLCADIRNRAMQCGPPPPQFTLRQVHHTILSQGAGLSRIAAESRRAQKKIACKDGKRGIESHYYNHAPKNISPSTAFSPDPPVAVLSSRLSNVENHFFLFFYTPANNKWRPGQF